MASLHSLSGQLWPSTTTGFFLSLALWGTSPPFLCPEASAKVILSALTSSSLFSLLSPPASTPFSKKNLLCSLDLRPTHSHVRMSWWEWVEYADDPVLIACTNETLSLSLYLAHFLLLQHLAARIGLLLHGSKTVPDHPCFSYCFSFAPRWCLLPMQLPLLRPFLSRHSWSRITGHSSHSTTQRQVPWLLHYCNFFFCSRCQLSLLSRFIRLQKSRSILSSSAYLLKIQAPSLYPDRSTHSPPWIWVPGIFFSPSH